MSKFLFICLLNYTNCARKISFKPLEAVDEERTIVLIGKHGIKRAIMSSSTNNTLFKSRYQYGNRISAHVKSIIFQFYK